MTRPQAAALAHPIGAIGKTTQAICGLLSIRNYRLGQPDTCNTSKHFLHGMLQRIGPESDRRGVRNRAPIASW